MLTFEYRDTVMYGRYFLIKRGESICGKIYLDDGQGLQLSSEISFTVEELSEIKKVVKEWIK